MDDSTDYVYSGLNIVDEVSGSINERHIYAGAMHIPRNTSVEESRNLEKHIHT